MKKYSFSIALALLCTSTLVYATEKNKLLTAIRNSDLASVKKFIRRLGNLLDTTTKQECLEASEDVLDEREAHVSLFKSRSDATRFASGTVFGLLMMIAGIECSMGYKTRQTQGKKENGYLAAAALSLALSCYSFYQAYRGISCADAQERMLAARAVYDELKHAQVKNMQQVKAAAD